MRTLLEGPRIRAAPFRRRPAGVYLSEEAPDTAGNMQEPRPGWCRQCLDGPLPEEPRVWVGYSEAKVREGVQGPPFLNTERH